MYTIEQYVDALNKMGVKPEDLAALVRMLTLQIAAEELRKNEAALEEERNMVILTSADEVQKRIDANKKQREAIEAELASLRKPA